MAFTGSVEHNWRMILGEAQWTARERKKRNGRDAGEDYCPRCAEYDERRQRDEDRRRACDPDVSYGGERV